MGSILSKQQIMDQSNAAYGQWADLWRENAKKHSQLKQHSMEDFRSSGIGKAVVVVANGASLEFDIETIKKHQKEIDIIVCDKALGHLIKNDIIPTYVIMADAKVSFEEYCEPYKDKLKDTILFANICGNTKWAFGCDWKKIYFYLNKDIIKSELEFQKISGCNNIIPAGSNVSNAMVILLTQCDNSGRQNFFGYDKILLTGFDYSWMPNGNYYAFDKEGAGKTYYMNHIVAQNIDGNLCYTSNNLAFSAKWLYGYVTTFYLPVINCSRNSLCPLPMLSTLEKHILYKFHCEDAKEMVKLQTEKKELMNKLNFIIHKERQIQISHGTNFNRTL